MTIYPRIPVIQLTVVDFPWFSFLVEAQNCAKYTKIIDYFSAMAMGLEPTVFARLIKSIPESNALPLGHATFIHRYTEEFEVLSVATEG